MREGLRSARLARGLTQQAAGAIIGKHAPAYREIEHGRVNLTAADALALAAALKTTVKAITPDGHPEGSSYGDNP